MPESYIKRITTNDTKKTYEFVDRKPVGEVPQLWRLDVYFNTYEKTGEFGSPRLSGSMMRILVVERQTLVNTGALPPGHNDEIPPNPPAETVEDLILRLLDMVGVRPAD